QGTGPNWDVVGQLAHELFAMGNEIGSHSFTHPENTNLLLPDQLTQAQLDTIRNQYVQIYGAQGAVAGDFTPFALDVHGHPQSDQEDTDPVASMRTMNLATINQLLTEALAGISNPDSLDKLHQAILDATFRFQFDQAKTAIEAALNITLDGVAIPGMPDSIS